jgi:hypothetical protein
LGSDSPLLAEGEIRLSMGGSVNKPNFSKLVKLLLKMICSLLTDEKFELTPIEKTMLLHKEMLKIMLGSG